MAWIKIFFCVMALYPAYVGFGNLYAATFNTDAPEEVVAYCFRSLIWLGLAILLVSFA